MSTTKFQFLHFDSIYAQYIPDALNTTDVSSNAYRARFPMSQAFQNIYRVHLKSLEFPVGFPNVRKGSTNTFQFTCNTNPYKVTLNEANYTNISTLLTDLNTALVGVVPSVTITASLSSSKVQLTFSGVVIQFSVVDTNFSKYILGFRQGKDTLVANTTYKATQSNYNLNPDNYVLMSIPTLNCVNSSMSGTNCTFKIPLNTINNQIYYYFEQTSYPQFVEINDPNLRLADLTVNLYDRYGNSLQPNGLDYSFTIAIEYVA